MIVEQVPMIDGEILEKLEPFKIRLKINSKQGQDTKIMLWAGTLHGQLIIRKKRKSQSPNLHRIMLNPKPSNLFNSSNKLLLLLSNIQEIHQEESLQSLFDKNVQVALSDKIMGVTKNSNLFYIIKSYCLIKKFWKLLNIIFFIN